MKIIKAKVLTWLVGLEFSVDRRRSRHLGLGAPVALEEGGGGGEGRGGQGPAARAAGDQQTVLVGDAR